MFKSILFWKISLILFLIALMLIPLFLVRGVLMERLWYQGEVISSVQRSSAGEQKIIGPVLVFPYRVTYLTKEDQTDVLTVRDYYHYVLPEDLKVEGNSTVENRQVGIYDVPVFQSNMVFRGHFAAPIAQIEEVPFEESEALSRTGIEKGQPYLAVFIRDARGITQVSQLQLNDEKKTFEPGVRQSNELQGIHIPVSASEFTGGLNFEFSLDLMGTKKLSLVPVGRNTEYQLNSNWPHPSFLGDYLPQTRTVSAQGFTATWQSNWLANNLNNLFPEMKSQQYEINNLPAFDMSLFEPGDQYQQTDRTTKYAILFISLTFMTFFLFEILGQLKVHPIQYLLVGLALVMFYLLLLALSEHIGFNWAYLVGSLSCSLLIGFYLSHVLKGKKRGMLFTAGLLMLYGILFGLLQSEDNALLMGSLLLLSVLGAVMMLTRRVDWYQVADNQRVRQILSQGTPTSEATGRGGPAIDEDELHSQSPGIRHDFRLWK